MLDVAKLKTAYATATGYTLFDEEGEVEHYYRTNNTITTPISGLWMSNPMTLTAIHDPTIGVLTATVIIAAPEDKLLTVRTKLNTVAETLNGTATTIDGYTVSYNIQTCSVGDKQIIGAGTGEYYPVTQSITYIIIESGISSYSASLTIDDKTVPILSLVCNKVNSTQVLPDVGGYGKAVSQQEAFGFDFSCPYVNNALGTILHGACTNKTANEAHYVTYTSGSTTSQYLMMFGNCTENVQPPTNVGFNISMVEVAPNIADFGSGTAKTATASGYTFNGKRYTNGNGYIYAGILTTGSTASTTFSGITSIVDSSIEVNNICVWWGDGSKTYVGSDVTLSTVIHPYTDTDKSHFLVIRVG